MVLPTLNFCPLAGEVIVTLGGTLEPEAVKPGMYAAAARAAPATRTRMYRRLLMRTRLSVVEDHRQTTGGRTRRKISSET
jgi:hypothetical protein